MRGSTPDIEPIIELRDVVACSCRAKISGEDRTVVRELQDPYAARITFRDSF